MATQQPWDAELRAARARGGEVSGYALLAGARGDARGACGTLMEQGVAARALEALEGCRDGEAAYVEGLAGAPFRVFHRDGRACYAAGARGALLLASRVGPRRAVVAHCARDPFRRAVSALEATCDVLRRSE